jgi:hypothetical protein
MRAHLGRDPHGRGLPCPGTYGPGAPDGIGSASTSSVARDSRRASSPTPASRATIAWSSSEQVGARSPTRPPPAGGRGGSSTVDDGFPPHASDRGRQSMPPCSSSPAELSRCSRPRRATGTRRTWLERSDRGPTLETSVWTSGSSCSGPSIEGTRRVRPRRGSGPDGGSWPSRPGARAGRCSRPPRSSRRRPLPTP